MDVSGIGNAGVTQATTNESASLLVLKKAIDVQAQSVELLLQGLPQPANNPPHLGQNVDVKA